MFQSILTIKHRLGLDSLVLKMEATYSSEVLL